MGTRGYIRPPWPARVIGSRMARRFKPQVVSRLTVAGRASGQPRSVAVAVLHHDAADYLMAAYGDTEWSRNLRAAGRGRLDRAGRTEDFEAVEVPVEEVPPLIEAYLREFGKLPTVAKTFAALPDPADHPTFRIQPGEPART